MSVKMGILASGTGVVVLTGAFVFSMGAVRVSVQEKRRDGDHIRFLVPGVVVPLGLRFVPDEKLQEASEKLRPWLPAIKVAAEELARCPDGPLVEVESPDEHVSIAKRGGSLAIDVDSDHETVHVSFPLRLVTSAARYLEAVPPATEHATISSHAPPES